MSIWTSLPAWLLKLFLWRSQRQATRRREVREALIPYRDLVSMTGAGGYPIPNTDAGWSQRLEEVRELRRQVVTAMDLDRRGAGRAWCEDVELCLAAGWNLVPYNYRLALGAAGDPDQAIQHLEKLQREFKDAYEKIL